jgi:hypothetical protein
MTSQISSIESRPASPRSRTFGAPDLDRPNPGLDGAPRSVAVTHETVAAVRQLQVLPWAIKTSASAISAWASIRSLTKTKGEVGLSRCSRRRARSSSPRIGCVRGESTAAASHPGEPGPKVAIHPYFLRGPCLRRKRSASDRHGRSFWAGQSFHPGIKLLRERLDDTRA